MDRESGRETVVDRWAEPQVVEGSRVGSGDDVDDLLPDWNALPEGFRAPYGNPWVRIASDWFHHGLTGAPDWAEQIDAAAAVRHLRTIFNSLQPDYDHKIAGVAYLLSRWCETPELEEARP